MKQDDKTTKKTVKKKSAVKKAVKKPMGSPLLLDTAPERIDKLMTLLASGLPIYLACQYSGIAQSTYFNYMNRAEEDIAKGLTKDNSGYINFLERVNQAQGEIIQHCFDVMKAHTPQDWRAADALLARIRPDVFGKKEVVTNNFNEKVVIKSDIPKGD